MTRRNAAALACLVMVLALGTGVHAAPAQTCYPPPCGAPVAAATQGIDASPTAASTAAPVDEPTAAPYVAAGLLMIMASLSAICLRRRANMGSSVRDRNFSPAGASRVRSPEAALSVPGRPGTGIGPPAGR